MFENWFSYRYKETTMKLKQHTLNQIHWLSNLVLVVGILLMEHILDRNCLGEYILHGKYDALISVLLI